jgi:hypothetical protein
MNTAGEQRRLEPKDESRLWSKMDKEAPGGCWQWLGCLKNGGYGAFSLHYKTYGAHRFVYEFLVGPIPDGLQLDHLCRNRGCVNPAHLEPVTQQDNMLRGAAPAAQLAKQTHCKRGHPWTEENTQLYTSPKRNLPYRRCRICRRIGAEAQTQRRREAREAKEASNA